MKMSDFIVTALLIVVVASAKGYPFRSSNFPHYWSSLLLFPRPGLMAYFEDGKRICTSVTRGHDGEKMGKFYRDRFNQSETIA